MNLYLQNIVETIQDQTLPAEWQGFDLESFSQSKNLFDYQQKALTYAIKALWLFYEECEGDKKTFYERYKHNGLTENLDFDLKKESKAIPYLREFENDYPVQDGKISFQHFINRMSFWMATGSGKTLVIVKLIELLGKLIEDGKIPKKDILFLTYREDLLEQFKRHIDEFNAYSSNNLIINIYDLKSYADREKTPTLSFGHSVDIYFYRSDLIGDERKDKIIDFRSYDNNGSWYIILDEAHKGDKDDSKRQTYYSILSRNGFLFNFSATFTDQIDYATCVYNFNLAEFIKNGYGKHIAISQENLKALETKSETLETEKQKILLKIFILQTAIHQQYQSLPQNNSRLYHRPLLLSLVNSVNTDDSDLELFFKEIEKIATGKGFDVDLFTLVKEELQKEMGQLKYEFEDDKVTISLNIDTITKEDVLKSVFNADTKGKIEVLKIPGNKQELVFKLATSSQPFALMKIGDITEWIKNKLTAYEIIEKFDNESIFKNLNNDASDINILMGSRAFYEGWDSNRPNIILFINIGKGTDAKKFVLQSIGRGVRIEPLPNQRKRALFLYNNKKIEESLYSQIKENIDPLETLFVFGTKADNLKEVVETLKQEQTEEELGNLFEINPDVKDKLLLIPTYKNSDKLLIEERDVVKFPIHPEDYELVSRFYKYIGDKIALCKYDCNVRVLNKIHRLIADKSNGEKENYFLEDKNLSPLNNPDLLIRNIFNHFKQYSKEFDTFKKLENEIIHFKRISISKDKINSIKQKIGKVKNAKDKDKREQKLKEAVKTGKITIDEYTEQIKDISTNIVKEVEITYAVNEKLKIEYLANHYYIPVILSESDKVDYIKHIIKTKSERDFINQLGEDIKQENNYFQQFDWWFFSKQDETLDEVYIPYHNPKTNRIDKFKPDFIFWLNKGEDYTILFIDPKGTEHTDAYRKIDGYKRIFEENDNHKRFTYNGFNVTVKLLLKPASGDTARAPDKYEKYWFDNFNQLKK